MEAVKRPQLPKVQRKKRQKLDDSLSEKQKNHVRRSNNRKAAQNLRNRKKNYEETLVNRADELREENMELEGRVRELATFQEDLRNKIRIISSVVEKVQQMDQQQQQQQQDAAVGAQAASPASSMPSPVPQQFEESVVMSPSDTLDLNFSLMEDPFGLVPLAEDSLNGPVDDVLCKNPLTPPLAPEFDRPVSGQGLSDPGILVPQQEDMTGSESSLESAAFKRTPLPSEFQNLSTLCCILGITSFLQPQQDRPVTPSSLPSGTSPVLQGPTLEFGLQQPSTTGPSQRTTSTGFLDPLLDEVGLPPQPFLPPQRGLSPTVPQMCQGPACLPCSA